VFSDALNNDLKAIKNAEILSDLRPAAGRADGLTWRQLGDWWADHAGLTHLAEAQVWSNLLAGLHRSPGDNAGERRVLEAYTRRYVAIGPDIPALIPQVYLHYDPYRYASSAGWAGLGPGAPSPSRSTDGTGCGIRLDA
jgi:hypothetical protein